MKRLFLFIFLYFFYCFPGVTAQQFMDASNFSNARKRIIAEEIINSGRLDYRTDPNIHQSLAYKHGGFNAGRISNYNSYLILPNYGRQDFHTLITYIINNGLVEADPGQNLLRFSIVATCNGNCQALGAVNNAFIGYFIDPNDHVHGPNVQKTTVRVIFSVMNMKTNVYNNIALPTNAAFREAVQNQNQAADLNSNPLGLADLAHRYAGDIITITLE